MSDEKKEVVVPAKFAAIVKSIEELSVLDLSELVKVLEEKFGVSAAAPAMMMAAAPAAAAAAEEKSEYTVELTDAGANKINVIKVIREVTQMGLKEAKDIVDAAPKVVKDAVAKADAESWKKKFEAAGAKVYFEITRNLLLKKRGPARGGAEVRRVSGATDPKASRAGRRHARRTERRKVRSCRREGYLEVTK